MSKVVDYIFKHGHYQEVIATYDIVQKNYRKAFKLWLQEQSVQDCDDYDFKEFVFENAANIGEIDGCINYTEKTLKESFLSVEWLYYDTLGSSSIPPLCLKEYQFIKKNSDKISVYDSRIKEYNSLKNAYSEAIERFLNSKIKNHSFSQMSLIVSWKETIKGIDSALRRARTCKTKYPLAWEVFSHGRTLPKIDMSEIQGIDLEAFALKERFVPIFKSHETLCKLILGCKNYDILDFSEEALEKENYCMQRMGKEFPSTINYKKEIHVEGDEIKRAILDSTKYGKDVKFVDSFCIAEFYKLREEADRMEMNFDDIITKVKDNYSSIQSFNKEKSGKEEVYIQDYIPASTPGSELYSYIENFQKQKELRAKAIYIAKTYREGFASLFGSSVKLDTCDLAIIQNILSSEQRIKDKDAVVLLKKREEEERLRFAEIYNRLSQCVQSWPSMGYEGFRFYYLFPYYPTTCDFEANESEWANRWTVWNFKNTPGKTSAAEHSRTLDYLLPKLSVTLADTFGHDIGNLTLVCIPAATRATNEARYKEFSERLTRQTGMCNSYKHIQIIADATPKHLGGTGNPTLHFDDYFFKGKFVLLFDDVITSGRSMVNFKIQLERLGAKVIAGLSIGKTKHERIS